MKLTLDALKERADAVASEELLATISGGTENACHDEEGSDFFDDTPAAGDPHSTGAFLRLGHAIAEWFSN